MTDKIDLTTLSAAKLALLFNAVTTGPHVRKFENTPRALERTLEELDKAGVSTIEAAIRAGLLRRPPAELPAPERQPGAFEAVNLVTGNVVPLRSLHDPLRRPDGDPEKAARKAAEAAAKALRVARAAVRRCGARREALHTRAAAPAGPSAAAAGGHAGDRGGHPRAERCCGAPRQPQADGSEAGRGGSAGCHPGAPGAATGSRPDPGFLDRHSGRPSGVPNAISHDRRRLRPRAPFRLV